jgi:tetratricopeptide (TPR) repeat protein
MYYSFNKQKKKKSKLKINIILFVFFLIIIILVLYYAFFFNSYNQIKKAIDSKKFTRAEFLIEKKSKSKNFEPLLYYYKGYLYFTKKDFFNSLLFFKKAYFFINDFNSIPNDIYYYIGLSYYYLGKEYYFYASKYLKNSLIFIKQKKNYNEISYLLGLIYIELGDFQNAYKYLNQIYNEYKENVEYLYYYSITLKNIKYYDKALNILKNILENTNDTNLVKNCFILLGKIYIEKNEYNESYKYFNEALKYNQNSSEIYYYLALLEYYNKNYTNAKNLLLKSLMFNPNNNDAILLLKSMK